jgi:glycosyltransferase involved in cell wall biosynthesis
VQRNRDAFARLAIPSASFAELCELPAEQVLVATNGTDTSAITPAALHDEPVVAMVSGAAPGRGIELLVEAMERVRADLPRAQLRLALAPTGPESRRFLATFVDNQAGRPWLQVHRVPYPQLSAFLGTAQVLVIPHPPGTYHDVATPVKLFDGMASGRPVVVTPRRETAQIVRATGAGVVAGDDADELADAISRLLVDEGRQREMGAAARRAAMELYDWRVISSRLADEMLGQSGRRV